MIDALGIVLGNRASAEYIREGEDSFWVQAVFEITDPPRRTDFCLIWNSCGRRLFVYEPQVFKDRQEHERH